MPRKKSVLRKSSASTKRRTKPKVAKSPGLVERLKIALGLGALMVIVIGTVVTYVATRQNTDNRSQAYVESGSSCLREGDPCNYPVDRTRDTINCDTGACSNFICSDSNGQWFYDSPGTCGCPEGTIQCGDYGDACPPGCTDTQNLTCDKYHETYCSGDPDAPTPPPVTDPNPSPTPRPENCEMQISYLLYRRDRDNLSGKTYIPYTHTDGRVLVKPGQSIRVRAQVKNQTIYETRGVRFWVNTDQNVVSTRSWCNPESGLASCPGYDLINQNSQESGSNWFGNEDSSRPYIVDLETYKSYAPGIYRSTIQAQGYLKNDKDPWVSDCNDVFKFRVDVPEPSVSPSPSPTPVSSIKPSPTPPVSDCLACNYQLDVFWGPVINSFKSQYSGGQITIPGPRYGWGVSDADRRRLLAAKTDKGSFNPTCELAPTVYQGDPLSNYTFAKGTDPCADPIGKGFLKLGSNGISVDEANLRASVQVVNSSSSCTYEVGFASYKAAWENTSSYLSTSELEKQNLFDYRPNILGSNILSPGQTKTLSVRLPQSNSCGLDSTQ